MTGTTWITLHRRDIKDPHNPWWAKCVCSKKNVGFSPKHDAYYCRQCYAWREPACAGENCEYCSSRPISNQDAKRFDDSIKSSLLRDLELFFGEIEMSP